MLFYYYTLLFISSILLTTFFFAKWGRNVSIYLSLIFLLIPLINLCYFKFALSTSTSEALLLNGLLYFLNFGLQFFSFLYVFTFCKIKLNRYITSFCFLLISTGIVLMALSPWTIGILYKQVFLRNTNGIAYLRKQYTSVHTIYYCILVFFIIVDFLIMLLSLRKKQISRRNAAVMLLSYSVISIAFIIGRAIAPELDVMPCSYTILQIMLLVMIRRIALYDIDLMTSIAIQQSETIGIASFDNEHRYLGCNSLAEQFFPEFKNLYVDSRLDSSTEFFSTLNQLMDAADSHKGIAETTLNLQKKSFKISVSNLYVSRFFSKKHKPAGHQIKIEDNTREQLNIRLLNNYNETLTKEVTEKTEKLENLMEQFVLGMAEMVQNRDNNTGKHIRRTRQIVKILTDDMRIENRLGRSNNFYESLVKAAPMHDLGKIAVDDQILRKPDRFTPEEFEIMKTHAQKGAEIVRNIFEDYDDKEFVQVCENVAHYHHERFDGSGYPEGLKGTKIPLEARIMAIADVYDALVSERCYKKAIPPEEAFKIIQDGMGIHFDPMLNYYFLRCREKIEEYYKS